MTAAGTVGFLVRAAREVPAGETVFTGFHWPMLAAHLARRRGVPFHQATEAGAVFNAPTRLLPTSTTEYPAYDDAVCFAAGTPEALFGLGRRFDRVLLDAANVDLRGCVNSSAVGPLTRPRVRLPGGGGAPDIAAAARQLVLLHGGGDPARIQQRVEHVTARPRPGVRPRLVTRFGVLELGARPRLVERVAEPGSDAFERHLRSLGVDVDAAVDAAPASAAEEDDARAVLEEAAERGYRVARAALAEFVGSAR